MPLLLLALFIIVPLVEIAILIQLGKAIGLMATIALVILTAIIGTTILRSQGLAVLTRANDALEAGRIPVDSVVDGVFLLLAGAFLLTPGLITDAVGFAFLIPPFRHWLATKIFALLTKNATVSVHVRRERRRWGPGGEDEREETILDGEILPPEEDDPWRDKPRRPPWDKI